MSLRPDTKRAIEETLAVEKEKWRAEYREETERQFTHFERSRKATVFATIGISATVVVAFCAFLFAITTSQIDLAVKARIAQSVESHQGMIDERARRADATLDEMSVAVGRMARRQEELTELLNRLDVDYQAVARSAKLIGKHDIDVVARALDTLEKSPKTADLMMQLTRLQAAHEELSGLLRGEVCLDSLNVKKLIVADGGSSRVTICVTNGECAIEMGDGVSSTVRISSAPNQSRLEIQSLGNLAAMVAMVDAEGARVGCVQPDQATILCTSDIGPILLNLQNGDLYDEIATLPRIPGRLGMTSLNVENVSFVTTRGMFARWKEHGHLSVGIVPGAGMGFSLQDHEGRGVFHLSHSPALTYAEFHRPGTGSFGWGAGPEFPSNIYLRDVDGKPRVAMSASRDGGKVIVASDAQSYVDMSWWDGAPSISITEFGTARAFIGRNQFGQYGFGLRNQEPIKKASAD